MLNDYFFWFIQPTLDLNNYDLFAIFLFLATLVAGMVLWPVSVAVSHPVVKKLIRKIKTMDLTMGFIGLVWVGARYENTPIFAKRFWAGLIILGLVIWSLYILKYILFRFHKEKQLHDDSVLKSRYMPGKK